MYPGFKCPVSTDRRRTINGYVLRHGKNVYIVINDELRSKMAKDVVFKKYDI